MGVSSTEDTTLSTQSPNMFCLQSQWKKGVRWNATSSQPPKPPGMQDGLRYFKSDQEGPIHPHRQVYQLGDQPLGPQPNGPLRTPTSRVNTIPSSCSGNAENHIAYQCDGGSLSSPPAIDAPQTNAFHDDTIWNPSQPLKRGKDRIFSPPPFQQEPCSIANVPRPKHSPQDSSGFATSMQGSSCSSHIPPEPLCQSNTKKRESFTEDEILSDRIATLRNSVPSLRVMSHTFNSNSDEDDDAEDLEDSTPAYDLGEATVLSKAMEYIHHLERSNEQLTDEISTTKARLKQYDNMTARAPQ